jgi:hypothetical protein
MRKIITLIWITFSALTVFGQNFEGKISYSNTYKSEAIQMTNEQLKAMMGGTQKYYIKDGDYKSVSNGSLLQWQLYVNAENKLYTKMANSEIAFWNDGLINSDAVLKVELNKNVIQILGYDCDELILTCKSGIQKYYFNTSIKVNLALFENHKFGNWYAFLKESKSLPLKMTISNAQFTMESIATEVKEMKLEASDLKLPTDQEVAKNPY